MRLRRVQAELLDGLAATDPAAERSRRDLQRVHRFMGTRSQLVRALRQVVPTPAAPLRVLELGAGDGTLMLRVARELAPRWPRVDLTLLDRLPVVDDATVAEYGRCGWTVRTRVMDVLEWARATIEAPLDAASRWDLVIATLFLHHFEDGELARLLEAVAASAHGFVACEPRRGWPALVGSHLIGAIGVNAVTRTDAVLSVRAGFRERELAALWPQTPGWRLQEAACGAFSHCFRATRSRVQ